MPHPRVAAVLYPGLHSQLPGSDRAHIRSVLYRWQRRCLRRRHGAVRVQHAGGRLPCGEASALNRASLRDGAGGAGERARRGDGSRQEHRSLPGWLRVPGWRGGDPPACGAGLAAGRPAVGCPAATVLTVCPGLQGAAGAAGYPCPAHLLPSRSSVPWVAVVPWVAGAVRRGTASARTALAAALHAQQSAAASAGSCGVCGVCGSEERLAGRAPRSVHCRSCRRLLPRLRRRRSPGPGTVVPAARLGV